MKQVIRAVGVALASSALVTGGMVFASPASAESSVTLSSPEEGTIGSSNPLVAGQASSETGVVHVVAGQREVVAELNFFGEFSTIELLVPPGETLPVCAEVRAADGTVLAQDCATYTAEPGEPYLTLEQPAEGSKTGSNVYLSGSVQPHTSVAVTFDGTELAEFEASYQWYYDIGQVAEGPHTVTVIGTDPFGQSHTVSSSFIADTTPPAVPLLVGPSSKKAITKPHLTVYGNGEPGSYVEVALADEDYMPYAQVPVADDGTWSMSLDDILPNYATGKRIRFGLGVRGVDDVGNVTPYTTTTYTLRLPAA